MADMSPSNDDFDRDEDFYEEDEAAADVLRAYERGTKGVTSRPTMVELDEDAPLVVLVPASDPSPGEPSLFVDSAVVVPVEARQVA